MHEENGGGKLAFSRPWPMSHGVACPTSSVPSTAKAEFTPNLQQRQQQGTTPWMHANINVDNTKYMYMFITAGCS